MATVNRSSEWVGNAYLYVMGDPNRKSYARNSKGFEPMENFFPAIPKPDSVYGDSDSDSGTEELVKERHQRMLEARQRRMDKKREQALAKQALAEQALAKQALAEQALAKQALAEQALAKQALAKQALQEDNRTGNGQQVDLNNDASLNQTSQAPIIVDPDTRDTSTVQPNMRETTTVELVTKETTVTRAPRDSTHTILVEEGNTAHTTSIEQQYSPEISMADGSLPKQFNTLQPSRLDFDGSSSEPERNTRMAPPLSTGEVPKKTKRKKTFTMPSKRKSRKSVRVQSETSQSDTDTNIETGGSFNPPISSTLNPDQVLTAKSQKKKGASGSKKEISSIQPFKKFDNTDSDSEADPNTTMEKLLGGALSRLSKYQTLLSRGQPGKSSQDEGSDVSKVSIPKEATKKSQIPISKRSKSMTGKKRNIESEVLISEKEKATIESEEEPATKKTRASTRKSLAAKSAAKNKESTLKKNRKTSPTKSKGRPSQKKDRQSILPKERTPSPPSYESMVTDHDIVSPNLLPMNSPPFNDDATASTQTTPTPSEQPTPNDGGTASVQTTPNDGGTASVQTTPTPSEQPTLSNSQRKFLKVKRFSIMLTKTVSPPGSVPGSAEKSTTTKKQSVRSKANKSDDPVPNRKKSNRKSSVGSSKPSSGSSSNPEKSHTVRKKKGKGKPETEVEHVERESPPVSGDEVAGAPSPDISVLPNLIRKRKNQTKLQPVKRRKIDQLQGADEELELTLSPGGRQYRRHKVGPRSARTPGVRRSRRTKIPPVRPWLGEKVEYEMRRKSGVSLKGYLVPNYDLDEPAPPKRKHTKRTTSQEAVNATDSDFEKLTIGDSSNEEEWTVVRTKASSDKIEINELANIDYYRFYSTNAIAFGVMSFQPMAIKDSCSNLDHQIVFHITTGRLQFKVNDIEYSVQPGMTVHIPPSSFYRIQNLHRSKAEVFYVAHSVKTNTD
ncbi:cell surface glycoprotein 1-like [Halichondria panicea]|uniref:cell surface glycoprotein 1-like n=1 Tax=Halichondria panicea TaxID=6063 RepID=UPI00312B920F